MEEDATTSPSTTWDESMGDGEGWQTAKKMRKKTITPAVAPAKPTESTGRGNKGDPDLVLCYHILMKHASSRVYPPYGAIETPLFQREQQLLGWKEYVWGFMSGRSSYEELARTVSDCESAEYFRKNGSACAR